MSIHPACSPTLAEILHKIKKTPQPMLDQTLVEMVILYLKAHKQDYTPFDARRWIKIMSENPEVITQKDSNFSLTKKHKNIKHPTLLFHLKEKNIPLSIAKRYLSELEVYHQLKRKHYFVLGFPHEKDGFVIANPLFQDWIDEPSLSFIKGQDPDTKTIHILHNFWDYVSLLAHLKTNAIQTNTIVLNSYDCIPMVRAYVNLRGYHKAYTWMSNDTAGKQATRKLSALLQEEDKLIHIAMNAFYQPFAHFNDWYQQQDQSGQ